MGDNRIAQGTYYNKVLNEKVKIPRRKLVMLTEYENKLYNLVESEELRNSMYTIKEAVDTIWSDEVRIIRDYTDHGRAHSQRIFQKLYEILFLEKKLNITEEELYLLILSVYLHDIGMQCDIKKHENIKELSIKKYHTMFTVEFMPGTANSYSSAEQNDIRKNHHLLTAAWLEYAYNHKDDILSNVLRKVNMIYIEDLINICMFHSKLNIMDCPEKTDVNRVRRRFVAALLRFGDELDIDQYRVNTDTVKEFGYETENSIYWYLHERTQIKIDKNEVIITVPLNPYDYELCHEAIEKLIITEFKRKNKILTDILIKNGITIFISESSKVFAYQYTSRLPEKELNLIIDLGRKKIEKENEANLLLINKINELVEKNKDLMPVIAGEPLQNKFAQNHINYVMLEADKLNQMILQLKYKYLISREDLKRTKTAFEDMYHGARNLHKYSEEITIGFQAFLFIQAFSTQQLTYLYDLGQELHVQVYDGQAQDYARHFFTFYFSKFLKIPTSKAVVNDTFDYYTFEQIGRILSDYEVIINFDFSKIRISEGYLYKRDNYGELLAVSVGGESNKIFIWDIYSGQHEPVAALGGLYEDVSKVKIVRIDSQVLILAKGTRQIYLWDLTSGNEMPVFIYRSSAAIHHYAVVRSVNENVYVIGVSLKDIYIWEMRGNENPVRVYSGMKEPDDILVIDSKLRKGCPSYALIRDRAHDSLGNSNILELKEISPLNYQILPLIDKKSVIGDNYDDLNGIFGIDSYQITAESKILGALTRKALILYDFYNKRNWFVIPRKGQQVLDFRMVEMDKDIYVLSYHLYFRNLDDGAGLVRCYLIRDGKIIEEKEWFSGKTDMRKAVLVKNKNSFYVFFNQYFDNAIYKTQYESNKYEEFFKLPNSMNLIDMVSG